MADWYYAKNGKQNGPITSAQLRQMAQSGEIGPDDLVFKEGGSNWIAASTVPGLIPSGGGGGGGGARVASQPRQQQQAEPGFDFDGGGGRNGGGDDDDRPTVRKPPRGGSYWGDMLMFRRMIAPTIIMILFWLAVAGIVLGSIATMIFGLVTMVSVRNGALPGLGMIVAGIIYIPIGILLARLYGELTIVIFRINENLMDLKEIMERQSKR